METKINNEKINKKVNKNNIEKNALDKILGNINIRETKHTRLRNDLIKQGIIQADCLNSLGDI